LSVSQISGIVSGLDTASLIDALVQARSAPMVRLQEQQANKNAELTAWQSFDAVLLALKIQTDRLGNRDLWNQLSVTTSDESHFTATAGASAVPGYVDLFVEQLASAHQIRSDTFSSRDELVGSGTFSLTIDGQQHDLAVASGTSVSDLAQQINAADLGVTASLVRSETLGTDSYHLVITANETGAASQFTADASGLSGGTAPDFTVNAPRVGQDAIVRFGGEDGLAVHSSTNTFTDLLDGVDVQVTAVHQSGESTRLEISRDAAGLTSRISDFVDAFNAVMKFKNDQYAFDPTAGTRPPLMGSSTLVSLTGQIRSALLGPVAGLEGGTFRTLAGIGLTAGADGTLTFDQGKFTDALAKDFDGVANLFRANAAFDASGVEWLTAPDSVDLRNRQVPIVVTQAAQRASLAGAAIDLGSGLVIDSTNDTFQISLDGIRSENVTLAHGTYTDGDALAQAIVTAVDHSDNLGSLGVRAAWVAGTGSTGHLELSSTKYGSAATVQLFNAGTDFAADLGFSSVMNVKAAGTDVAGTIDGITAKGTGQVLQLADDTPDLGGMSFRVTVDGTDTPSTITASFSEGVGRSTSRQLLSITDSASGTLARLESSIQSVLDRYAQDIQDKQDQLDAQRARLEQEYANLETTLSKLQSQGQYVAAQIQAMYPASSSSAGSFRTSSNG
jgi:flagellar hook-associated protein 2